MGGAYTYVCVCEVNDGLCVFLWVGWYLRSTQGLCVRRHSLHPLHALRTRQHSWTKRALEHMEAAERRPLSTKLFRCVPTTVRQLLALRSARRRPRPRPRMSDTRPRLLASIHRGLELTSAVLCHLGSRMIMSEPIWPAKTTLVLLRSKLKSR